MRSPRAGISPPLRLEAAGQQPTDTGLVAKTGLLPEIAAPAFAAADGAVVGPVKTVLGWQLAKVTKVEPGKPAVLAEVHDQIAKQLADRQASDELVEVPISSTMRWPAAPRWRRRPRSSAFPCRLSPMSPATAKGWTASPSATSSARPSSCPPPSRRIRARPAAIPMTAPMAISSCASIR